MTPERWEQIEQLYQAYLEQAPEERSGFLDDACAEDPSLREELESLLEAHDDDPVFLETAFGGVPAPPKTETEEGKRIGPYKVLRRLAHGGMGTVYLAERADGSFEQTVALKLVRSGFDSDDLLSRFRYERQILAALDHPNIARLLDGGMTTEGRPYFVMEYVDGVPITTYCDTHRLSTKQRLTLFRTVCRAVQFAHQNLVVHRDLKPSNILVTEDGTVKLLDFGIAKLLDEETESQTTPQTQTGMRLMTPEYASPEQIRGEAITTATDVYQLGVLLYELLTGHRPYRMTQRLRHEVERVILEEEPTRPSTAIQQTEETQAGTAPRTPEAVSQARSTSLNALRRRLAGDLDTIVLMALKKEPDRRYASVELFSEDIRRHLTGLPVLARDDTLAYRTVKFVRRHRFGVATASIILIMLLAFSLVTAMQSAHIQAQAEAVALERDKAEEVAAFMVDLFQRSDRNAAPGAVLSVEELLERGAQKVETDLVDQPETQAELMEVLGRVQRNLARYDEAERLTRRALDLRRSLYGTNNEVVIESMHSLALVRRTQGAFDEAEQLYRGALEASRETVGNDHALTAASLHGLGMILGEELALYNEAEPILREALTLRRAVLTPDHPDIAVTLAALAHILRTQKNYAEAEPLQRESLDIKRTMFGASHPQVAASLNGLAMILTVQQKYDEAIPLYDEALVIYREQLGAEHPHVATILFNMGRVYLSQKNFEAAEPAFRNVLALRRQQYDAGHPRIASAALQLGRILTRLERPEESEPLLRETIAIRQETMGDTNWQVAYARMELGMCLSAQQRYAEAEPLLKTSHAILAEARGADDRVTLQAKEALAHLHEAWQPSSN